MSEERDRRGGEPDDGSRQPVRHPVASVVIPAFNEEAALPDCLDSLLAQSLEALEIIVVDDGSTDRTAAVARSRGVVVMSVPHGGPAAAKNAGAARATGDVLVFIDADHILERSCIERLVAPIVTGVSVGTFTRDIRVANPENPWADCWTANRGAKRGEHFPRLLPDQWENFRAVGRRAFLDVGGFDDVGYGEDMTLAPKLGALADVVPGAEMLHRHPDTLREVWQNARWVGRGPAVRTAHTTRRFLPQVSLKRGLRGARRLRRPRFLVFAFVYDFGVLSAYWETRLGRRFHAK
jgi:glycosyltransferase involved in cell wall biosynthesis